MYPMCKSDDDPPELQPPTINCLRPIPVVKGGRTARGITGTIHTPNTDNPMKKVNFMPEVEMTPSERLAARRAEAKAAVNAISDNEDFVDEEIVVTSIEATDSVSHTDKETGEVTELPRVRIRGRYHDDSPATGIILAANCQFKGNVGTKAILTLRRFTYEKDSKNGKYKAGTVSWSAHALRNTIAFSDERDAERRAAIIRQQLELAKELGMTLSMPSF